MAHNQEQFVIIAGQVGRLHDGKFTPHIIEDGHLAPGLQTWLIPSRFTYPIQPISYDEARSAASGDVPVSGVFDDDDW
jgi:hypothetical protein